MEPRPDGRGKLDEACKQAERDYQPQWSPDLMAGGSSPSDVVSPSGPSAAMEPRPDGRGK